MGDSLPSDLEFEEELPSDLEFDDAPAPLKVTTTAADGPISHEPGSTAGRMPEVHGATGARPDDATDAGPSTPKKRTPMEAAEAFLLGQGSAGTLGFGDEFQGGKAAIGEALGRIPGLEFLRPTRTSAQQASDEDLGNAPLGEAMAGAYRKERDTMRSLNAQAEKEQRLANLAGSIAVPIPGFKKAEAATKLGRAAITTGKGTLLGLIAGLGTSDADLGRGEYGQAAKDTGVGGLVGGGVAALAEGGGALKQYFGGKRANAAADALAKSTAATDDEIASALGKSRSKTQEASRDLEVTLREAEQLPAGAARDRARAYLDSPDALALREQVLASKLESAPDRIEQMRALKEAHQALVAGKEKTIADATEKAISPKTALKKAGRFAYNYGTRFGAPALGYAIGNAVDAPALGVVAGGVLGAVAGHAGTAFRNLVKDPSTRRVFFGALEHTLGTAPEKLGRYAPVLAAAAAKGTAAFHAETERIAQSDPDFAGKLDDMASELPSPATYGGTP